MQTEKISLQHVQLPNNMTRSKKLTPNDLWVYICIKSFMNGKTKECYPSLAKISEKSGISIPIIRKSIELLVADGWLFVEKSGRSQKYLFKSYKNFEVFSITFIDNSKIDAKGKAYLASVQQFMFTDTPGFGKISYTNEELSNIINLSPTRIDKYNQTLMDMGYLSIVDSDKRDASGLRLNEKYFHLDELGQAIVFALKDHHEELVEHKEILDEYGERINNIEVVLKESNEVLTRKLISKDKTIKDQLEELKILREVMKNNGIEISENFTEIQL